MRLVHFIVCDDIRQEVTNKHTLVGVYDDLVIHRPRGVDPKVPFLLKLAFFARLARDASETALPDAFHLVGTSGGRELFRAQGRLSVPPEAGGLNVAVVASPLPIPQDTAKLEFAIVLKARERDLQTLTPPFLTVSFVDVGSA